MSQVFVSVGASLDGFIAGPNGGPRNPLGDGGARIHHWMFQQRAFLASLGLPGGEEGGQANEIITALTARAGAHVMGKRMFDEGEPNWPEDAPFHAPVFVLTKQRRAPWERKGGTTFYFVNDGLASGLAQARQAAGAKDVRLCGGAHTIRQALDAGVVEELTLHVASLFLGVGVRLFERAVRSSSLELVQCVSTPGIAHLTYRVTPSAAKA